MIKIRKNLINIQKHVPTYNLISVRPTLLIAEALLIATNSVIGFAMNEQLNLNKFSPCKQPPLIYLFLFTAAFEKIKNKTWFLLK